MAQDKGNTTFTVQISNPIPERPHEGRSLRYDSKDGIGRGESGTETENETGVRVENDSAHAFKLPLQLLLHTNASMFMINFISSLIHQ